GPLFARTRLGRLAHGGDQRARLALSFPLGLIGVACAQLISLVWRLLIGRAAHAPLGLLLLLKGLAITLELSLGSLVLGSLGGIVLGAMRSSEWRILKAVALVYIEAVRAIPFVILPVLRCTSRAPSSHSELRTWVETI